MSRANHVTVHVTGAINFTFLCIYLNSVLKKNHVENGHNPSSLTLKHFTVNTFCFLRYTGFDSPNIRTYQQKQKKNTRMAGFNLSEESKERLTKALATAQTITHYGWLPLVVYLGWASTQQKPNLVSLLSPLPSA